MVYFRIHRLRSSHAVDPCVFTQYVCDLFFRLFVFDMCAKLHEKIRTLSMEAGRNVKERGLENNLLELIAADDEFPMTLEELQKTMDPSKYVGRAPSQVVEFMNDVIQPILDENKELLGVKAEINV